MIGVLTRMCVYVYACVCVRYGVCYMVCRGGAGGWQGLKSQGGTKPLKSPGTVQASLDPPQPSWPRPLTQAAPGESQAPAICVGHGSCPQGHTAFILIKLGCLAGKIRQEAPAGPHSGAGDSEGQCLPPCLGLQPQARSEKSHAWHLLHVWGSPPRGRFDFWSIRVFSL